MTDLRCYIEPKDNSPASERDRVATFHQILRLTCPHIKAVAVPNAAKRGWGAQALVKAEGLAKGFPDMLVLGDGNLAFLEFKSGRTMPRREQVEWLNWLHDGGYACAVVRSPKGALAWLKQQGFRV